MGACIVFGWRYRIQLPPHIGELFRVKLLPWVGLNLFIGFAIPNIDNFGHLGGLITGAALAAVTGNQIIVGRQGTASTKILMFAGAATLMLGALIGVMVG